MRAVPLLIVVVVIVVGGCRQQAAVAAGVDAMCVEHGVVEALCTKHHPALIAVFQAKDDWCPEHGLPESICPQCHPERGGRPAADVDLAGATKPVVEDRVPAEGLKVTLKNDFVARQIGIETAVAVERQLGPSVTTTAHLVYDAARVAVVNARATGVVREVRVDVGTRVKQGQVLARLESASVGADRSALIAVRAALQTATTTATRQQELADNGIGAAKDLQRAQQELQASQAAVAAAEAAVGIVGDGSAGSYALTSPFAGVVVERHVAVGQGVSADAVLFQIVDASVLWAELDVPERELGVVAVAQRVELGVDALVGRRFTGLIDFIAPSLDVRTRTARARVAVKNPEGALRAGMLATARIVTGGDRTTVVVPRRAVQRIDDAAFVFVKIDERVYEVRRVDVGVDDNDVVEVVGAVHAGDVVVTTGGFLLKTETLKGAIGAGCCD